jgi:hypothetical protein
MSRKVQTYQDEILQALNVINQTPREIHSFERVEVRCSSCKEVHSIQLFWTIIKRFKEKWYGWECKRCSYKRRKIVMSNKWSNKEEAEKMLDKMKETCRERFGTEYFNAKVNT